MKKLITLLLILAMILPASSVAELRRVEMNIPDISGLSFEELKELDRQIHMQMFGERLVSGVPVPVGKYVIGEDIPAGTYRIETTAENGFIALTSPEGKAKGSYLIGSVYDVMVIGKIVLEEGYTIEIDYGNITIYAYSGLF